MFFKKPSLETMNKRKEEYSEVYSHEIKWLKKNWDLIKENSFLVDMYGILLSGSRPMSEKMIGVVRKSMKHWMYDPIERAMREEKIKPIKEKISLLEEMVKYVDKDNIYTRVSAYGFLQSIKKQCNDRLSLSEKQMGALNKVYKKYKPKFDGMYETAVTNKEQKKEKK
tara:strand:+ start:69 stop:572 length:504 start_codon:yes stop_codon:yes gene_type:complete